MIYTSSNEYIPTSSILNCPISFCRGSKDTRTVGNSITIGEALDEIKSEKYGKTIQRVRELPEGSEEQSNLKRKLKAYLFCGEFSVRNAASLTNYSHIFVLDIDKLSEDELLRHKLALNEDPYVIAYWTSPRGAGIKGLIMFRFSIEPDFSDYANIHRRSFDLVLNYYSSNYEIFLDNGRDVSRLCYTSSDSQLVLKEQFQPFLIDTSALIEQIKQQSRVSRRESVVTFNETSVMNIEQPSSASKRRKINSIIKFLEKRNLSITGSYSQWYLVGQAIANEFSYSIGKKYYLRLCRLDGSKHNESKSIRKLIECYSNTRNSSGKALGLRTIVNFAREQGYINGKQTPSSDADQVEKV